MIITTILIIITIIIKMNKDINTNECGVIIMVVVVMIITLEIIAKQLSLILTIKAK